MVDEQYDFPDKGQRIALVSTDYPPLRTSAAVQMHDLAVGFSDAGHSPVMILPTVDMDEDWVIENIDNVVILRIKAPKTRDVSYVRRALMELSLPFLMLLRLRNSPFAHTYWDIITWYSPTIFFGPFVWYLKRRTGARTYLILRDIFPEWTLDLGIMRKGLIYAFFKTIAYMQYAVADVVGVQTESNLVYMEVWRKRGKQLEVLNNWQTPAPNVGSTIEVSSTVLAGRKVAVYIGNMGVAQGMDVLIELAQNLNHRADIGFLFVGRGSEISRLKGKARDNDVSNILFFDEVDSSEMPGLLSQCFIGLLALDMRHKTHNIPGKFLTYLYAGLPVLASVNGGTDLMRLINEKQVGRAFDSSSAHDLREFVETLMDDPDEYANISRNCSNLAEAMFSTDSAVNQILASCWELGR